MHLTHSMIDGPTLAMGDAWITPRARVLTLRTRFGGLVWNHPRAVLVERDGQTTRLSILDVTRLVQAALWACVLVAAVASVQRRGA